MSKSTKSWAETTTWHTRSTDPSAKQIKIARKLLHDPDFNLDEVMIDVVARFLMGYEGNNPIINKYLNEES